MGLLAVVYSGAQFVAAPILGWLSDRHGRRPVLLLSVLGSAVGYYLFAIGGALGQLNVILPALAAADGSMHGCFRRKEITIKSLTKCFKVPKASRAIAEKGDYPHASLTGRVYERILFRLLLVV